MSLFPQSLSSLIMRPSRGTGVQRSNEPKRIHLNVGGECHSPYVSTLKNLADSPLAMILRDESKSELDYDHVNDVYFFDRHPGIFAHILNYFQTGKLHCPRDVCGPMFEAELHFWGIDETQMEACCWSTYTKHREIQENLKLLRLRNEDGMPCERSTKLSDKTLLTEATAWERKKACIWEVLDEPYSSSLAKAFSYISLGFIILSIITYSLLSMKSVTGTDCTTKENITCVDNHKCLTTNTSQQHYDDLIINTNHLTLQACASACCSNTTCTGFDFEVNTSTCWMKHTTREKNNVTKDDDSVLCTNDSSVAVPCNESYACLQNNQFHSNQSASIIENSTRACADQCCSNSTCIGFDYDVTTKKCWLSESLKMVELKATDHNNIKSCFKVSCTSLTKCSSNSTSRSTPREASPPAHLTRKTYTTLCENNCCGACSTNQIGRVTSQACNITADRLVQITEQYQERFSCKRVISKKCKMRLLHHVTRGFEILFAVWFTIEIILRIIFCPNRTQYLMTATNWFDSMAVIPVYLLYCFPDSKPFPDSSKPFMILNMLRYVRVFRLFKLLYDLHILGRTLKASLYQLMLLVFILFFPTLVFSSFVHYSEKTWGNDFGKSEFNNMPESLWWSVIIMTTVGYGDKAPTSITGRLLGGIAAIIGIILVSMTASILGSSFQQYYNVARAQLKIPHNPHSSVQREDQRTLRDYFRHLTNKDNSNSNNTSKPPDNTLSPDSKDSGYGHSPLPAPFIEPDHSSSSPVFRQRNVIITIDDE